MAISVGEQTEIVLRFLRGLAVPHVRDEFGRHGFDQEEYERGWNLLRETTEVSLVQERPQSKEVVELRRAIVKWEKRWVPILNATFAANFPGIDLKLFPLGSNELAQSPVNVDLLLRKLDMVRADALGQEALALLERRGLSASVLQQARDLLAKEEKAIVAEKNCDDRLEERAERRDRASAALWAWYLEWSAIARAVFRDRGTLRLLGFRRGKPREAAATT